MRTRECDSTDPLNPELSGAPRSVGIARTRAMGVLGCVMLGVVLGRGFPSVVPELAFGLAALFGLCAVVVRGRIAPVVLGVVLLSLGWVSARLYTVPSDSLLLRVKAESAGVPVRLRGIVVEGAESFEPEADAFVPFSVGHARFDLRLTAAMVGERDRRAWESVSGVVVVHGPVEAGGLAFLTPGSVVEVRGMLRVPSGRLNPGEPDWLLLARQKNAVGFLSVPEVSLIEPVSVSLGVRQALSAWRSRVLGGMRSGARERLGFQDSDGGDPLLGALLLGIRGDGSEALPAAMRRLGLAHLMAISGFHLALAAGFALFLLRAFRDLGRAEPVILAVLVLVYLSVLPVRTPVLRAALMVLGLLGACGAGRRYDARSVLAWIAVGLLVWRPLDLFSLGFQLSLGITALLLTMPMGQGPGIHQAGRVIGKGVVRWPIRAGGVCVKCWAVGQPAVLAHFGMLSPLAWLATLIVVLPITGLLAGGYVAFVLGGVWPSGGRWVIGVLGGPAEAVARLVGFMDTVPGAWFQVPLLPWWVAMVLTVSVLGVVLGQRGVGRGGRIGALAVLLIVSAFAVAVVLRAPRTGPGVLLRVDTIAVGNGSCHLVRSGAEAMLFDAGSLRAGVGREVLPSVLRGLGVTRVRAAVVSHPNLDHYNALPDLVEPFGIERVYLTPAFFEAATASGPERLMLNQMRELGVELVSIEAGDSLVLGAARVDVLWPPAGKEGLASNDTSILARAHASTARGPVAMLFTGDAGEIPLSTVLGNPGFPVVHVLELPHHGSYNAVSEQLVRRLNPAVVVQSTGMSRVGDSRWEGVKRGREWRTTATEGCITTTIHGDGRIEVRSVRGGVIRRAIGSPG